MFPFSITQERRLDNIKNVDSTILIEELRKELIRLKIYEFEFDDIEITFKNKFFNDQGRNHLMKSVDAGYFKIDKRSGKFIYSYSLARLIYITVAMSIFIGIMSQKLIIGVIACSFFCGLNWIISVIRHTFFMNRMKKRLSKLVNASPSASFSN